MAIEPIKGFYVHDEATNTDGVAKYSYEALDSKPDFDVFGYNSVTFSVPANTTHSSLKDQLYITIPAGTTYSFEIQVPNANVRWKVYEVAGDGSYYERPTPFIGNGLIYYTAELNIDRIGIFVAETDNAYTATIKVCVPTKDYAQNVLTNLKTDGMKKALFNNTPVTWERGIVRFDGSVDTGNGATSGVIQNVKGLQLADGCRAALIAYKGAANVGKYNSSGGFDNVGGNWGFLTGYTDIEQLLSVIDADGIKISVLPTDGFSVSDDTVQTYGENHAIFYTEKVDSSMPVQENTIIKSVNHRGYSTEAPENTLPAYKLSRKKGFRYVETDIYFTSDNIPVCLHDETINRTARNADGSYLSTEINIADITYQQALTYDFGIWFSSEFAGTKIPTLTEFLVLCKKLSLHPYIELKTINASQAAILASTVKACGMGTDVTFISFSNDCLSLIAPYFPNAELALAIGGYNSESCASTIAAVNELKAGGNFTMVTVNYSSMTSALYDQLRAAGISTVIWTVNEPAQLANIDDSVRAVLTDNLKAGTIIENLAANG